MTLQQPSPGNGGKVLIPAGTEVCLRDKKKFAEKAFFFLKKAFISLK